jgi:hypothetical protein
MKAKVMYLSVLLGVSSLATARSLEPTSSGKPTVAVAPTGLNAPDSGVLSGISVPKKAINIGGRVFRIAEPMIALVDRRAHRNGLLELTDLKPGMRVRYRSVRDVDGVDRVVELWVESDGAR